MTVRLHRDTAFAGGEHILELEAFLAPRGPGLYWHEPRSAHRKDGRLSVQLWCGQFRHDVKQAELTDEEPLELRCGTCRGRRDGFDRAGGNMVFRPRDPFAVPKRCPGGDDGTGHCVACGRKLRYYGAFYSRPSDHRPEPELTDRWQPCPDHGWLQIAPRGGQLVCMSFRCLYGPGPVVT